MSFIIKAASSNKGGTKLKKIVHNDNERKRKKRMIEMIDKIVELIPMKCGGKTSRIGRLEKLHSYIIELKNKNDGLMFANPNSVYVQEIKCLKKYIEHLERLNRNYHKLLKLAGISPASAVEMGDRDWKKPLKYSNQVCLESDETTMNDLTRRNRVNGSSDDSEKSVEDEDESSESEENNTSLVKSTPIQLVNSAPILPQEAQSVQYVLLSVRPNTQAQFVPIATPILSNGISSPTIILGSNLSTTPCTSKNSLSKTQQEKSINSKLETEKNQSKKKKNANLKGNNHKEKIESLKNNQTITFKDFSKVSNLTTTIVENNDTPEKETADESQIDAANNVQGQKKRPVDQKRQNNKRNSTISESVGNLMSKKTKADNLTQLENPEKKQPVAEKMPLPDPLTPVGSPKKLSPSTKPMAKPSMTSTSTIGYNESNDSVVPDKLMPNSTARGDYSTERLLQQQPMLPAATVESQANKSSSGRETCSLNQPLQSSLTEAEQPPSYQQQNTPRFTVKNTFINCSPPNNAQGEKPNFDMNSQIKRSLLDMSETQGIPSSTTTTPHLFDPMPSISTTEYQQQSLMPFVTWSTEPTGSHNSTSSGSANATTGTQPYGNTNHASVLFANQPPFSILSTTTPTPFDPSAVSNVAVFSASPHKPPAPSNSSIAFNSLMADFNSTSYSLAHSDDQHNQTEVSIIDSFPRSSRSASSMSVATRSQSARSSAVTTASNTSASYGKAKTSSSKATTLTTSTSSTRAKSNALNPKKNLNKSSSSATSSSITEPKSSLPTSSVTSSTPSNLFSRHHHPHHGHPTQPNRHILNDNYLQHIIPEIVSVNSGHSSSVLGSNGIAHTSTPTGPTTTFHPSHSHTHHPHQFQSYTNFFAPSQSQTSFEPYDSPHVNGSDTGTPNDISEHNQLSCYPIYRPQSQTSHAFAPTNIYQPGQSTSSTLQTRNFVNPPTYTHPHSSGTSSSHVTNFNIYNLLPDTTLNSSGSTGSYGSSEFLSASKVQSSRASTSVSSSTSAATSLTPNTLLPKFAQLAKSLPSSVSSSIVDPFASSSAYQNPSTAHHPPQYHHPATHHPFYPPPPTAASQTSVTYSTSHPLNSVNSHFTSSSAISNQSRNPGRSSAFASSEDHDSEAVTPANSANTRASSLGHFYSIPPHNSGVADMSNMFTPSGSTNQNSSQHGQSASTHHLPQHPHFSSNVASSHAFNQASTVPTSISNFNIQSSISIGNGSGSTSAFGSAPSAPNQRIPFTLFNL